ALPDPHRSLSPPYVLSDRQSHHPRSISVAGTSRAGSGESGLGRVQDNGARTRGTYRAARRRGRSVMTTFVLLLALAPAQRDQDRDSSREKDSVNLVLQWNEHALEAIRRDRTAPPVAARNLAVVHLAVYDAVNTIYPD